MPALKRSEPSCARALAGFGVASQLCANRRRASVARPGCPKPGSLRRYEANVAERACGDGPPTSVAHDEHGATPQSGTHSRHIHVEHCEIGEAATRRIDLS